MMGSDVWEQARRFVEEGERQQAEKEAILARYERANIHGKVLVDGHHLFLQLLRDIDTFNHHVEQHPGFSAALQTYGSIRIPNVSPRLPATSLDSP
jgi:hypothetical protein